MKQQSLAQNRRPGDARTPRNQPDPKQTQNSMVSGEATNEQQDWAGRAGAAAAARSEREVLFLVARYLLSRQPLRAAAEALEAALASSGALGSVVRWDGVVRPARIADFEGRFREAPSNQLVRLLGAALDRQDEDLAHRVAEATADAEPSVETGAETNVAGSSSTGQEEEQSSEAVVLQNLRARLSSFLLQPPGRVVPSSAEERAEEDMNQNAACRPRVRPSGKHLVELVQEERGIDEEMRRIKHTATEEELPAYLAKRLEERNKRLRVVTKEIKALRFVLRDDLLERSRRSSSIVDLVSKAQLGQRIEAKLIKPARELACKRLQVMKKIHGHKAHVFCVAVDKTGRWIVTGSDDALCKLWNARTGELNITYRAHEKMICDVSIDKTNRYLASCSVDTTVRIWELLTGRHISVLSPFRKCVNVVLFEQSENMLVAASDDGVVCVWDTQRILDEEERQINAFLDGSATEPSSSQPPVTGSEHSPTGPVVSAEDLAAAGVTNRFLPPKVPIVLPHVNAQGHLKEVNMMSLRPGGGFVATAAEDGVARIWAISRDLPSRCARAAPREGGPQNLVESEYVDGSIRLVTKLRGHLDSITMVEWSSKGDRVLSGSIQDGTVRVWYWHEREQENDSNPNLFTSAHQRVLSLAKKTNKAFASSAPSSNMERRRSQNRYKMPSLDTCAWGGDDRFVIVLQSMKLRKNWDRTEYENLVEFFDQRVLIFNSFTGQLLHNVGAHRRPAFVLRAHPWDSNLFLTAGHDCQIFVWDVYDGKILAKLPIGSEYGPLTILDAQFTPPGTSSTTIAATDVGGRLILIGSEDGAAYIGAYPEQFLANDYSPLLRDENMNVLDEATQLPVHLVPRMPIVDSQGAEYAIQPIIPHPDVASGGTEHQTTNTAQAVEKEIREEKRDAIRKLETLNQRKENAAMSLLKEKNKEVDDKIRLSNMRQSKKQARAKNNARKRAPSATNTSRNQTGRTNVNGFDGAPGNSSAGLLAVERAEAQFRVPQNRPQHAQLSNAEEPSRRRGGRHSTRRAARMAQSQIREFQEFENERGVVAPEIDDDEQWEGARNIDDDDDDDEEMYVDEIISIPNSDDEDGRRILPTGMSLRRVRRSVRRYQEEMDELEGRAPSRSARSRRSVYREDEDDDMFGGEDDDENFNPAEDTNGLDEDDEEDEEDDDNQDSDGVHYDRKWLQGTSQPLAHEPYSPQVGDIAVYCVQGHREYLRTFPLSETAPWQLPWWKPTWPVVVCRIREVDYEFPKINLGEEQQRHTVLTLCDMEIICTPTTAILQGKLPVEAENLWEDWKSENGTSGTFKVHYRPYGGAEFLVLKESFDLGMKLELKPGDHVSTVISNDMGMPSLSEGEVCDLKSADPEWPGSPWGMVKVSWQDGDDHLHSPWRLRKASKLSAFESDLVENNRVPKNLSSNLIRVLKRLCRRRAGVAEPFVNPVNHREFPDYEMYVQLPMDLRKILRRLRRGYYRHPEAIQADFRLIVTNCYTYNDASLPICQDAAQLLDTLLEVFEDASKKPEGSGKSKKCSRSRVEAEMEDGLKYKVKEDEEDEEGHVHDDGEWDADVAEDDEKGELGSRQRRSARNAKRRRLETRPVYIRPRRSRRPVRFSYEDGDGDLDLGEVEQRASRRTRARTPRSVVQSHLIEGLHQAHENLMQADQESIFAKPVDEKAVPSYRKIIKKPMDLSTILCKFLEGRYGNSSQGEMDSISRESAISILRNFEADATLMCNNAIQFNENGTPINSAARQLKERADKEVTRLARSVIGLNHWTPLKLQEPRSSDDEGNSSGGNSSDSSSDGEDGGREQETAKRAQPARSRQRSRPENLRQRRTYSEDNLTDDESERDARVSKRARGRNSRQIDCADASQSDEDAEDYAPRRRASLRARPFRLEQHPHLRDRPRRTRARISYQGLEFSDEEEKDEDMKREEPSRRPARKRARSSSSSSSSSENRSDAEQSKRLSRARKVEETETIVSNRKSTRRAAMASTITDLNGMARKEPKRNPVRRSAVTGALAGSDSDEGSRSMDERRKGKARPRRKRAHFGSDSDDDDDDESFDGED